MKKIVGTSMSGWCITGHHDNCPYRMMQWSCNCDCHRKEDS